MKVIIPFPAGPENLQSFLVWCVVNLGQISLDWDIRPYDRDYLEVDLNKDDPNLVVQLKLVWG